MMLTRRHFIRGAAATAMVATSGTLLYSVGPGRHALESNTVRLKLGLNQPLRLVALGDIHFDPLYEGDYLAVVMKAVSALQPDLVVYTGDFVTNRRDMLDYLGEMLMRPAPRLGCFAVLGNHDHWAGADKVMRPLEHRGLRFLCNESFALPGEEDVYLTGLDSFWAGTPDLGIFGQTPETARHVLVVHEPDPFATLLDPRIKLQISGHTHGGQVRLPLAGAIVLPKWGRHYDAGLFQDGDRRLYVNRGIGTLRPHVRFDCPPEITLFELT